MKRKRDVFEEEEDNKDGEEEIEIQEKRRKKRKLSDEEPNNDFVVHNGDSNDDEDGDDSDEDLPNKPEAGIIEKIELQNFMCHSNLVVNLGSHINIITGNNGTGKSAILQALQVALGARKTRDSSNITGFIKTGEEYALVRVTLRNKGSDGYMRDVYGKRIIIERYLTKNGQKTYKIMDDSGGTVSRKKSELENILVHFNIRVSNPTCVMTQGDAKKFLAQSTSKVKYEFFLEGTQLQTLLKDFAKVKSDKKSMESTMKTKNERLVEEREHVKAMEEKVKITDKLGDMEKEKDTLRAQKAWMQVVNAEKKMEFYKKNRDDEEKKVTNAKKELQLIDEELLEVEERDKELSNFVRENLDEKIKIRTKYNDVQQEKKDFLKLRSKNDSEKGDLERNIANTNSKVNKIKKKIKMLEELVYEDVSEEQKKYKDKIQEKKEKIDKINENIETMKDEYQNLRNELSDLNEKYENKNRELNQFVDQIDKEKRRIRQLKKQEKDPMAYFSDYEQRLLQLVNKNASKFSKIPIGPLCLYLSVPKERKKWAVACELSVKAKRFMKAYICNTKKDSDLIRKMCRREDLRIPPIIVFKYCQEEYSIDSDLRPPQEYHTVFDVLQVDTSIADNQRFKYDKVFMKATLMNVLMNNLQIERTILIEEREEATKKLFKSVGGRWPKNTFKCFCKNGTFLQISTGTEITSTNFQDNPEYWGKGKDFTKEIESIKEKIKRMKNEDEKQLKKESSQIGNEKDAKKKESIAKMKSIKKLKTGIMKIQKQIKVLENELEDLASKNDEFEDKEEEIDRLKDDIEKLEEKNSKFRMKITKLEEENEEIIPKQEEIAVRLRGIRNELDANKERHEELSQEVQEHSIKQTTIFTKRNHHKKIEAKHEKTLRIVNDRIANQKQTIEGLIEHAKTVTRNSMKDDDQIPNEIEIPRMLPNDENITASDIDEKIAEIARKMTLKETELDGMTIEQISRVYKKVEREFSEKETYLSNVSENLKQLNDSLSARFNKWKYMRERYANTASLSFNRALSNKNHSGKLSFRHDDNELDLEVSMGGNDGVKVKKTEKLSGGEKSFTTVAMLLSFWDVCESPFRAMDEVDIYMDNVYRKKAFDLLLDTADSERHRSRQMIILTPLSTSSIKRKPNIKIIKLKDRDGLVQTTLDDYNS